MRSIFLTVSLLAATLAASAQGQAAFEWRGTLQPGQTLEIRNIQGNIQAVPATGSEVEISVQITGTRPDPSSIRIYVDVSDGGVLVCTIYERISHPNYCTPDVMPSLSLQNSDIKVQYFLKVPEAVKLVAKTINGRPLSRIKAETVNGRITVATQMPVEANLVNGSIDAPLIAGTQHDSYRAHSDIVVSRAPLKWKATSPIAIAFRLFGQTTDSAGMTQYAEPRETEPGFPAIARMPQIQRVNVLG